MFDVIALPGYSTASVRGTHTSLFIAHHGRSTKIVINNSLQPNEIKPILSFLAITMLPVMLGTIHSVGGQDRERAIITTIFSRSQRKERPQLGFQNGVRARCCSLTCLGMEELVFLSVCQCVQEVTAKVQL